jgi:hypothetical protein
LRNDDDDEIRFFAAATCNSILENEKNSLTLSLSLVLHFIVHRTLGLLLLPEEEGAVKIYTQAFRKRREKNLAFKIPRGRTKIRKTHEIISHSRCNSTSRYF